MTRFHRQEEFKDLGYSTQATTNHQRLLNRDGTSNIIRRGVPFIGVYDIYNTLITMSWRKFFILVFLAYFIANTLFAFIYMLIGIEHLDGIKSTTLLRQFADAFFFSAQTISTVGYGHISPQGIVTSLAAALECLLGLLGFALITGLLYGRFSRPTAKIIYSKHAIIAPYREGKSLMFRMANLRINQLIECEVQVLFSRNEEENEKKIRKYYILDLERKRISIMSMNWTVVHPITDKSPLYGLKNKDFEQSDTEFMVLFKAFDDTFAQSVHSRMSYKFNEILWDVKFKPMFSPNSDGVTELHLDKINEVESSRLL